MRVAFLKSRPPASPVFFFKAVPKDTVNGTYGSVQAWVDDSKLENLRQQPGFDVNTPGVRPSHSMSTFFSAQCSHLQVIYSHTDSETKEVVVVLTTLHLLLKLVRSASSPMKGFLAIDGTYRVTGTGLPVLVVAKVSCISKI